MTATAASIDITVLPKVLIFSSSYITANFPTYINNEIADIIMATVEPIAKIKVHFYAMFDVFCAILIHTF